MHPLIIQQNSAIAEICRQYQVRSLEVFGSAARGVDFDVDNSDADFLIEFLSTAEGPSISVFQFASGVIPHTWPTGGFSPVVP